MEQSYQVTARKWRPQRFDEVVGQDHITRTLKNAIREGRLAHGYLFTGQRGCGKTTVARILAKAINCPNAANNGYEPCNECESCKSITNGSSMDVAEIDGASNNSVDDVREMRENVKYPPLQGKYRVIIIDEVHMLSNQAFNALLKTLEEPPRHLVFVFATTEVQKVLPTILSRTQRYDFRRMQIEEIVARLRHIAESDGMTADDESLLMIAKKADGSMRDGQSIFDQAVAYCGNALDATKLRDALNLIDADFYFEVTEAIKAHATAKAFDLASEVVTRGYDIEEFIGGLLDHLRAILTVIATGKPQLLEVVKHHQDRYSTDAKLFSEGDMLRLTQIGFRALERLRNSHAPRIVLELMLVEMTLLDRTIELRTLLDELKSLKGAAQSLPASSNSSSSSSAAARSSAPAAASTFSTPSSPGASLSSGSIRAVAGATQPPVIASAPPSGPAASAGEIESRWNEFLDFIASASMIFGVVKEDMVFGHVAGSIVEIVISKKHTEETFARNKDKFTARLQEFFSNPQLNYTLKKVERRQTPLASFKEIKESKKAASDPGTETIDDGIERSELELALMRDLGARPL